MTNSLGRDVDTSLDGLDTRLAPIGRQSPPVPPGEVVGEAVGGAPVSRTRRDTDPASLDRARIEALVTVVKELAMEVRSSRRDIERIKTVIAKLRLLTDAQRRAARSTTPSVAPRT